MTALLILLALSCGALGLTVLALYAQLGRTMRALDEARRALREARQAAWYDRAIASYHRVPLQ